MSQPRISEIERPGERKLNLETLLRLASAFDVALQVKFVPFSKFVDDDDAVDFDNFYIAPFEEDIARLERFEEQMKSTINMGAHKAASGEDVNWHNKKFAHEPLEGMNLPKPKETKEGALDGTEERKAS